jgi:putative transposase
MARSPRRQQQVVGAYYHVMNRGHNRETVFQQDGDYAYFLDLLDRRRQRFGVRLYHYCLMGNHFHLLLDCQNPVDLSRCMAGLLRAYVHYFNRRSGFVDHLWQGRFKSSAVFSGMHGWCSKGMLSSGSSKRAAQSPFSKP